MLTNLTLHLLQKVLQGFTAEINRSTTSQNTSVSGFEQVQSILETAQSSTNLDPNLIAVYPQLADLARACAKSMIDKSYPISSIQRIYSFVEHFESTSQNEFIFSQPMPSCPFRSTFPSSSIHFPAPTPAPAPVQTPTPPKEEEKPTLFSFKIDSNITKDKINKIFSEALKINQIIDTVLTQVESTFAKEPKDSKPVPSKDEQNYDLIPSYSYSESTETSDSYSSTESDSDELYESDKRSEETDLPSEQTDSSKYEHTETDEPDSSDILDEHDSNSTSQNFEENDFDSEVPLLPPKRNPPPQTEQTPDSQPLTFNRLIDTFLKTTLDSFSNPETQSNLPNLLKSNLQDVCELVSKNSQQSSDILQKIIKEFEKF